MADRQIDRGAWATVVADLIHEECGGNKSKFATLVGTTYKTVNRWLAQSVDVRESSVRAIADALGRNPLELLVAVGYYAANEVNPPAAATAEHDDPIIQQIRASGLAPRVQMRMIQRLRDRRASETAREADEVRWWIEQAKEA